jgi:hypothetical protein
LLDPPVVDAVDGLRRAVGDPSLDRVPAHLTLVPPVNVRADQLPATLAVLRAAAGRVRPMRLTLGPPATFLPDNPVLYLEVGGDLDALRTLRDMAFRPPLQRTLTWPWIPHVTLSDMAAEERIAAASAALDRFAMVAPIDRVVLLEERSGRRWEPLADATLGRPAVVGRGGLALEVTRSRLVDPEVHQMLAGAGVATAGVDGWPGGVARPSSPPIVLSARREGQVVGLGVAWRSDAGGQVAVVVAPPARSQGVGGTVLAHLEAAVRAAAWECPVLPAHGPAGFYEARSSWAVPAGLLQSGLLRSGLLQTGVIQTAQPRTGPAS